MIKRYRFTAGLISGLLIGIIITAGTVAYAGSAIKLIINGKEIHCEVPPTVINGRTMVMARDIAENLGAKVQYDSDNNSVIITGQVIGGTPTDLEPKTSSAGQSTTLTASTPVKSVGHPAPEPYVVNKIGETSYETVSDGKQIATVTINVTNVSTKNQICPFLNAVLSSYKKQANISPESRKQLLDGRIIPPGTSLSLTYSAGIPNGETVNEWKVSW